MQDRLRAAILAHDESLLVDLLGTGETIEPAMFMPHGNERGPFVLLLQVSAQGQEWSSEILERCAEECPRDPPPRCPEIWSPSLHLAMANVRTALPVVRGLLKGTSMEKLGKEFFGRTAAMEVMNGVKAASLEEAEPLLRLLPYEAYLQKAKNGDCALFAAVSGMFGSIVLDMIPPEVDIGSLQIAKGKMSNLSVVHCCVLSESVECIEKVLDRTKLEHWITPTSRGTITPLHKAMNRPAAKLLIDRLPDEHLNPRKAGGVTPFMLAKAEGRRLLLERLPFSTLNVTDDIGRTPLFWALAIEFVGTGSLGPRSCEEELAACSGVLELMEQLSPEEMAMTDEDGTSPLLLACRKNLLPVVEALLAELPPEGLKATDQIGNALHAALTPTVDPRVVSAVLKAVPASLRTAPNVLGRTPEEIAEGMSPDIAVLFCRATKSANG